MNTNVSTFKLVTHIVEDHRFYPTHIALYIVLLRYWQMNHCQNSFRIYREEVMKLSKIKSIATYHKCIKDLNDAGFIVYSPSFNTYRGTLVDIVLPDKIKESLFSRTETTSLIDNAPKFLVPSFFEVELYFNERNFSSLEAKEFYNFYDLREWRRINDKLMISWQAAARNWIINLKK
ncbi:hypothetical protein ACFOWU_09440 [Epilithonimonas zeae]|uniref:Uncharacterized protein n=1 Tax=Epilithonimonas zeae TaxID=1416779 RepID=A0A1N6GPE2_9FLAO|nr:hypothetical protein [Epilithonimonas zeae]SIO09391.1 hypothetical protein SAMN05444409_1969 [Epilithonimonas zeae]